MKKLQELLLLIVILGCSACNQVETNQENITSKSQPSKKEIDQSIDNVFEFSEDTIFACRTRFGLIYSLNKGESWTTIAEDMFFNEITITDNGYLVGLDYWQGIHEADRSRLYLSKDFGNTWQTITLNTEKFFPVSIVSLPHQKLQLLTVENKIYELNGNDYSKDWKFIKTANERINKYITIDHPIKIDDYHADNIKLYVEKGDNSDTLAKLSLCRKINSVMNFKDFIYIAGYGYVNYHDEVGYGYFATLDRNNKLKEHKIPGHGSYLKKTQLENMYLFNDEGLYVIQYDSLKKIY